MKERLKEHKQSFTAYKKEIILGLALAIALTAIGSRRFMEYRADKRALRLPYELLMQ